MNLEQFKSLLDELLEDLVAYHQKALVQGKLWLKQSYLETDPAWGWMEENHLDELLQYILSLCYKKELHQKGLAQRKLRLELTGIMGWKLTNLTEEFEEKWRNRCQSIDSIDCRIEFFSFYWMSCWKIWRLITRAVLELLLQLVGYNLSEEFKEK